MNITPLLCACVATTLLGGPVLAETADYQPLHPTRFTQVLRIPSIEDTPLPINMVRPSYPYELRREGIQGLVMVDMLVDSAGRVVSTAVAGSTEPELNAVALAAAKKWTFEPIKAKGKRVLTRVRVPFEFTMPQLLAGGGR